MFSCVGFFPCAKERLCCHLASHLWKSGRVSNFTSKAPLCFNVLTGTMLGGALAGGHEGGFGGGYGGGFGSECPTTVIENNYYGSDQGYSGEDGGGGDWGGGYDDF